MDNRVVTVGGGGDKGDKWKWKKYNKKDKRMIKDTHLSDSRLPRRGLAFQAFLNLSVARS